MASDQLAFWTIVPNQPFGRSFNFYLGEVQSWDTKQLPFGLVNLDILEATGEVQNPKKSNLKKPSSILQHCKLRTIGMVMSEEVF